jgi:MarR family transcriptional regulator for hemolysin
VRPERTPIGLSLTASSRLVSRAFGEALAEGGGSLPVWLVLLNLQAHRGANQRQLAAAVGVSAATLTHHLNAMESDGLLARRRDPENRRNHIVELTEAGEAAFARLAPAVLAFDQKLRANFTTDELDTLHALLARLCQNVDSEQTGPAWAGLIEDDSAVARKAPPAGASRED